MTKFLMVGALVSVLSGCATMFDSSNGAVSVTSASHGVRYDVTNSTGMRVASGETPNMVTLKPSAGYMRGERYTVVFTKPGSQSVTRTVEAGVAGWYWANILVGGLVGMLIVDPATGKMYTLPDQVHGDL